MRKQRSSARSDSRSVVSSRLASSRASSRASLWEAEVVVCFSRARTRRSAARTVPAEASAACWCSGIAGALWGTLGLLTGNTGSLGGVARHRCLAPPRGPRARRDGGRGGCSARIAFMQTRRAACEAPRPSRRIASRNIQPRCEGLRPSRERRGSGFRGSLEWREEDVLTLRDPQPK